MDPTIGTQPYYFPFVNSLIERLDWNPAPDKVVWHYTNGDGLIGIIESGSIFATQISCLNDSTEIRYSAMRLREALLALIVTMDNRGIYLTPLNATGCGLTRVANGAGSVCTAC
jgi:hypothetical protein